MKNFMKKKLALILIAIALVAAGGVYWQQRDATQEQVQRLPKPATPVVGRFATSDQIVTIYSDGNQNLFSIAAISGSDSSELLDRYQLQQRFPKLYQYFTGSIADKADSADLDTRFLLPENSSEFRLD